MGVGDPLVPTNTQQNVISASPGALGEVGSTTVDNNNYTADGWEYLNKESANVALQQKQQVVLPSAQQKFDDINKKYTELFNNPDFLSKKEADRDEYNRLNPIVTGGRYTETVTPIRNYTSQLTEAKNAVWQSFDQMKNARSNNEFNAAQQRFNENSDKLNTLYNTAPETMPVLKVEKVAQQPTGYQFASEATGWIQPNNEAFKTAAEAEAVAGAAVGFRGNYGTERNVKNFISMLSQPVETKTIEPGVSLAPSISQPDFHLMFPDVSTKEQIDAGLANAKTNREKLYWLNEQSKLQENIIGLSSQYHAWANSGNVPTPTNPFDIAGDAALHQQQLNRGLTGKNLTQLPQAQAYINLSNTPYGGQGYLNPELVLPKNNQDMTNYWKSVNVGDLDKPVNEVKVAGFDFKNPPAPFLSSIAGGSSKPAGGLPVGFGVIGAGSVLASEVNKKTADTTPVMQTLPKFDDYYNTRVAKYEQDLKDYEAGGSQDLDKYNYLKSEQQNIKTLTDIKNMSGFASSAIADYDKQLAASQPVIREEPKSLSPMGVIQDFTNFYGSVKKGDTGEAYRYLNQATSRFTTRIALPNITGIDKNPVYQTVIDTATLLSPARPIWRGVLGEEPSKDIERNIPIGLYNWVREQPLDVVVSYYTGKAIPGAEYYGSKLIAGTATRNIPLLSKGAQLASGSNLLKDTYTLATRVALPTYFTADTYDYIKGREGEDTSPAAQGQRTGESIGRIGLLIKGAMDTSYPGVNNPYHPKAYSPLEKLSNRFYAFKDTIGKPEGQKTAMRELIQPAEETRFITPAKTTEEINLANLKQVGKYAPAVEEAGTRQVTSMYGSGTIEAGASDLPTGVALKEKALPSSDYDAFANKPPQYYQDLADIVGGKVAVIDGKTRVVTRTGEVIGTDIHPFPEGYADIGQTVSSNTGGYSPSSVKFKVNPYIDEMTQPGITSGYKGKITYEQLNVQTQKSFSDLYTDLSDPLNSGYRIPKAATRTKLLAEDLIAVEEARGGLTPARKFELDKAKAKLNKVFEQEITYKDEKGIIRTEKIKDASDRYIASKRPVFDEPFRYTPTEESIIRSPSPSRVAGASSLASGLADISKSFAKQFKGTPSVTSKPSYKSPSPSKYSPLSPISPSLVYSPKSPSPGPSSPKIPKSPSPKPPSPGSGGSSPPGPSITSSIYDYRSTSYTPPSPPSYYFSSTSITPPIYSPKIPKTPKIPGGFFAPPGGAGGGGQRGYARGIRIVNPLNPLVAANAGTAARFNRVFSGNMKSISNVNSQRRGNLNPIANVQPRSPRKQAVAANIGANIGAMFSNKKKKKGMVF